MSKAKQHSKTRPSSKSKVTATPAKVEDTTLPPRDAELVFDPATRKKLLALASEYEKHAALESSSKDTKKSKGEEIEMILVRNGIEPKQPVIFADGPRLAIQRNEGQEYIDEVKLLSEGIGADVIARCRSRHKASSFVRVTWPKAKS